MSSICMICKRPIGRKSWYTDVKNGVQVYIAHAYCWMIQNKDLPDIEPDRNGKNLKALDTRKEKV